MVADSRNSSTVSSSLVVNSVFPCSKVFVRMVGIPISVGLMASIPYVMETHQWVCGQWFYRPTVPRGVHPPICP